MGPETPEIALSLESVYPSFDYWRWDTNPRFRETCSTGIHHTPRTNNNNRDRSAVITYEIALCIGGIGSCGCEGVTTVTG